GTSLDQIQRAIAPFPSRRAPWSRRNFLLSRSRLRFQKGRRLVKSRHSHLFVEQDLRPYFSKRRTRLLAPCNQLQRTGFFWTVHQKHNQWKYELNERSFSDRPVRSPEQGAH